MTVPAAPIPSLPLIYLTESPPYSKKPGLWAWWMPIGTSFLFEMQGGDGGVCASFSASGTVHATRDGGSEGIRWQAWASRVVGRN